MYILINAIRIFTNLLSFLIFVRCIISWFPIGRNNPIVQLLYTLTEPILSPIRRLIEKSPLGGPGMMIDFAPLIAFLLIGMVSNFLIEILAKSFL